MKTMTATGNTSITVDTEEQLYDSQLYDFLGQLGSNIRRDGQSQDAIIMIEEILFDIEIGLPLKNEDKFRIIENVIRFFDNSIR